jgi:Domain found in Dishevelled, Egl-10, and Pleckstrin (DEP)
MSAPALLLSLVGDALDPILSATASARKAPYQRTKSVAQLVTALETAQQVVPAVVVELSRIAVPSASPRDTLRRLAQAAPQATITVVADHAHYLYSPDTTWLQVAPNVKLVCAVSALGWPQRGKSMLKTLFGEGDFSAEMRRMEPYIRALEATATPSPLDAAQQRGIDYLLAAQSMVSPRGVHISDRRFRLKLYSEVFVAREAYTWMQRILLMSSEEALLAGRAMQEAGLIYHVVREQDFADEEFFFRVASYPKDFSWVSFLNKFFSKDGPARKDRTYHAKIYPLCLQGQEMFSWMRAQGFSDNEAMTIGQRMIALNIIHHVADAQPFRADNLFFRALHDENALAQPLAAANPQYKAV